MSNFKDEIKSEVKEVKEDVNKVSFAYELLKDQRKQNKRLFILLIIVLLMWFSTIGYLVYILNDIGTVETTVTQDNSDGYNNYIGNDGDINNG